MPNHIPDLWDGCYDGEARQKMSPEQFRKTFCAVCTNPGCRNSRGVGTLWAKRMMGQEDLLLNNPRFADPDDPQYKAIRAMPFENMIRQALAIEVSNRKGDWSIPTELEIGRAASEMMGMYSPAGFQVKVEVEGEKEPDLEDEEPKPPERLVDEVKTTHQDFDEEVVAPRRDLELPPPPGEKPPEGRWRIKGDKGDIYEVTLRGDDSWECSCPSRENPCKHARSIIQKLRRAAPEPPEAPASPEVAATPTPPPSRLSGAPPNPSEFRAPSSKNTRQPKEGVMVGGGAPPPKSEDPWAPAPQKKEERVIPVGGKVRFSRKK
jgi:hypothetical protein